MRQAWFNQRVQMESLRSELFMITLTYNEYVPHIDFKGYKLQFPDYRDIQNMCKRIRKKGWKFRYWFCSEYGRKHKRPHYHGLIAIDRNDYPDVHWSVLEQTFSKLFLDHWSVNVGSRQNPKYKPLLTYVKQRNKCTYDFHHVEAVPGHDNDLSFYCSKYVLKYDDRTDKLLKKFFWIQLLMIIRHHCCMVLSNHVPLCLKTLEIMNTQILKNISLHAWLAPRTYPSSMIFTQAPLLCCLRIIVNI